MVLPGRIIPIIGVASFRKCSYCSDMERKIIDTAASQQECCGAVLRTEVLWHTAAVLRNFFLFLLLRDFLRKRTSIEQ